MKKTLILITVSAVCAIFAAGVLPALADGGPDAALPGVIVDFSTQEGYERFDELAKEFDLVNLKTGEYTIHGTNGKVEWEFVTEEGESFTRFKPIVPLDADGKDPETGEKDPNEGDFRMTAEIEFDPEEYGYISFCYRAPKKAHFAPNNIYIRDDQHSGEFEGTAGMWTPSNLKANGEWVVKTIKIKTGFSAVSGTVKSLRIPIPGREGENFDIKYVAVFKDKDSAEAFDLEKYHEEAAAVPPEATPEPPEEPTAEPGPEFSTGPRDDDGQTSGETPKSSSRGKTGCGGLCASALALLVPAASAVFMIRRKER